MMGTVRLLCRPELEAGLALTGLPTLVASDGASAGRALNDLAGDPRAGVVLVESRLHDALPDETVRRLRRTPVPVVLPFPSPTHAARPGAAEEYIVEMLRRAIGYRIRLR